MLPSFVVFVAPIVTWNYHVQLFISVADALLYPPGLLYLLSGLEFSFLQVLGVMVAECSQLDVPLRIVPERDHIAFDHIPCLGKLGFNDWSKGVGIMAHILALPGVTLKGYPSFWASVGLTEASVTAASLFSFSLPVSLSSLPYLPVSFLRSILSTT